MDKIPFAENLQECLPNEYGQNLALMDEKQLLAMYEDNRRWRECEERFKQIKNAGDYCEKKRQAASIAQWILSLKPHAYREDMRSRMNHLREKYKNG